NATGLNGRRTVSFVSPEYLRNNDGGALRPIFQNQTGGWAFAVVKRRSADGSPTLRNLFSVTAANGNTRFVAALGQDSANTPALLVRRQDPDSTSALNGATSIGTSWAMILWLMDWANGAGS